MKESFTKEYNVKNLVYYEKANEVRMAIKREKQLKKWYRKWKIQLIEEENPEWEDLSKDWYEQLQI
jgi:putative endonuclease